MVSQFPRLSETFIVSKFVHLLAIGWDVHILATRFNRHTWNAFDTLANQPGLKQRIHIEPPSSPLWKAILSAAPIMGYVALRHPMRCVRYLRRQPPNLQSLKRFYLDSVLLRIHPDILHFEFGALAQPKAYLKQLIPTRLAVSFRGYDISYVGLPDPHYYNPLWRVVDGVHFLGQDLLNRAIHRGFRADDTFHMIIPPAVDLRKFPSIPKKYTHPPNPLRILSIGRLEWKKGYEYALLAVKALQNQGIPFEYRIVGDGQMRECLYLLRHRLGLSQQVHLLGAMPHRQVLTQLQWADVLLHASVSEGFCNAVQEAQAMRVPPVVSDAEGLPENVADGITGFVVPRRDPHALADKLEILYRDPALRKRMGTAGRQRITSHFSIQKQSAAFDRFYTQLMAQPPR